MRRTLLSTVAATTALLAMAAATALPAATPAAATRAVAAVAADPAVGVYQVWGNDSDVSQPFVRGGQIRLEWRDVETARGRFAWGALDTKLAQYRAMGKPATIQINSTTKPAWLWGVVAHCGTGVPQYWDPLYLTVQSELIGSLAAHLKASPYRANVALVRANPNAIGTELTDMRVGVACAPATSGRIVSTGWTKAIGHAYFRDVMGLYRTKLAPEIHYALRTQVFTTNDIAPPTSWLGGNDAWMMQTATDIDPNPTRDAFDAFALQWLLSGRSQGYMEPHDTTGKYHLGSWNYWRMLLELHKGVQYVAVYGQEIQGGKTSPEYREAFDFVNRYAGTQTRPLQSPGAWVALKDGYDATRGNLMRFMSQVDPAGTSDAVDSYSGKVIIGNSTQRFGRFARRVTAGTTHNRMSFKLDPTFRSGIRTAGTTLRLIYLDTGLWSFQLRWGPAASQVRTVKKTNNGKWMSLLIPVSGASYAGQLPLASDISVTALDGSSTFHMVEVKVTGR